MHIDCSFARTLLQLPPGPMLRDASLSVMLRFSLRIERRVKRRARGGSGMVSNGMGGGGEQAGSIPEGRIENGGRSVTTAACAGYGHARLTLTNSSAAWPARQEEKAA